MTVRAYPVMRPADIRPAHRNRDWMDESPDRFAYHCLPLVIANEAGWLIHLAEDVSAEWGGGLWPHELTVDGDRNAGSHFGSGIVTFTVDSLFRTDPGVQLLAVGPMNWVKDGVQPLAGIVETDWASATFTMNWKLTRPGVVSWKAGEPICHLVPVNLDAIKAEQLVVEEMPEDVKLEYVKWSQHRAAWPGGKRQLHYRRGEGVDSDGAKEKGCPHFTTARRKP